MIRIITYLLRPVEACRLVALVRYEYFALDTYSHLTLEVRYSGLVLSAVQRAKKLPAVTYPSTSLPWSWPNRARPFTRLAALGRETTFDMQFITSPI